MNKVTTLRHYAALEGEAKEAAEARKTIEELRFALHAVIRQLSALSAAISIERVKCVDVMDQAHAVLLSTLPGADLDAMTKPERRETLADVIFDMTHVKARP